MQIISLMLNEKESPETLGVKKREKGILKRQTEIWIFLLIDTY